MWGSKGTLALVATLRLLSQAAVMSSSRTALVETHDGQIFVVRCLQDISLISIWKNQGSKHVWYKASNHPAPVYSTTINRYIPDSDSHCHSHTSQA